MLTPERLQKIMEMIQHQEVVKLSELVDATGASESTIRRDLSQLEKGNRLKRVHGGAARILQKGMEPSIIEKSSINLSEKKLIAKAAANLIKDGDCIFLDAGTTTYQMIPLLENKKVKVVTNGFAHIQSLMEKGVTTYIIGGYMKNQTGAIIGSKAVDSLKEYYFDKAFIGTNGVHIQSGFTTPDPEEAIVKSTAIKQSNETFILADISKFNEIAFAKIANISSANIITNRMDHEVAEAYREKTSVTEVHS
ncbi:DeoR/GlpR family DNA-binding transcription regulator [Sutcliffiella rhizosphaerae]|uniref:Glucitol operon repressor n=1 Tax=Sutcliffiella rhizosphaerae TaxID=2880967 RepID=A0ABN8A9E3_9BACI|nr:DeoR/GlpR family DNA-binding transcription regulator [Sutcliffiella rhizosphaerae]CAG9621755.1 Glucitol operon repressor [Sutcliffiella rhizosphaerae]